MEYHLLPLLKILKFLQSLLLLVWSLIYGNECFPVRSMVLISVFHIRASAHVSDNPWFWLIFKTEALKADRKLQVCVGRG